MAQKTIILMLGIMLRTKIQKGEFDASKNYYIGDIVYNDGSLFNAITNLTDPFDATYPWIPRRHDRSCRIHSLMIQD